MLNIRVSRATDRFRLLSQLAVCLAVVVLFVLSVESQAKPKCPGHPSCQPDDDGGGGGGEDPPSDGAACVSSSGSFPAAVYQVDDVDKRGRVRGSAIYATNSDMTCSVHLLTRRKGDGLEFKMVGDEGFITWTQNGADDAGRRDPLDPMVKLVKFQVIDKEITTALPLPSTSPYSMPETDFTGLADSTISDDGNALYVVEHFSTSSAPWVDKILEVDISSCSSNCGASEIFVRSDAAAGRLVSKGNRIYFGSLGNQEIPRDELSYIENNSGWSATETVIASSEDTLFPNGSFRADLSVASMDINDDGVAETVVATAAHGLDNGLGGVYLLNIDGCTSSTPLQSCLAAGSATLVRRVDNYDLGEFVEGNLLVRIFDNNDWQRYDPLGDTTSGFVLEATDIDSSD